VVSETFTIRTFAKNSPSLVEFKIFKSKRILLSLLFPKALRVRTPSTTLMAAVFSQTSASRSNSQERVALAKEREAIAATAEARGEVTEIGEEVHLPETSASGVATRVIGVANAQKRETVEDPDLVIEMSTDAREDASTARERAISPEIAARREETAVESQEVEEAHPERRSLFQ